MIDIRKSETYRRALAGEKITPPRSGRTALCIDRGRLVARVGSCRGNDLVVCDRFLSVVSHLGACQTCPAYIGDA